MPLSRGVQSPRSGGEQYFPLGTAGLSSRGPARQAFAASVAQRHRYCHRQAAPARRPLLSRSTDQWITSSIEAPSGPAAFRRHCTWPGAARPTTAGTESWPSHAPGSRLASPDHVSQSL